MSKKMRTRLGQDGYNYPYTHEDLIFNNDMVPLSQKLNETKDKLNETKDKLNEIDTSLETKASTEFVNDTLNDKLNGLRLMQITRADYDALETKDPSTLYIII